MHKQQNKHGPGTEAGTCIAWLLRPEALQEPVQAAGLRADGYPPPLRAGPHEKEWPPGNTTVQRRRRRRRCLPEKLCLAWHQGEGPPGDAIRLIINNIDPAARSRLLARGHLYHGVIKADFGLMGEVRPDVKYNFIEKDKETRRRGDKGKKKGRPRWLSGGGRAKPRPAETTKGRTRGHGDGETRGRYCGFRILNCGLRTRNKQWWSSVAEPTKGRTRGK